MSSFSLDRFIYCRFRQNPDCITKKRIERLRQEIACFAVFESRKPNFRPDQSFEDERIARLIKEINCKVTNFFVILIKNYVFVLSFKERQLSGNGKIGMFFLIYQALIILNINVWLHCRFKKSDKTCFGFEAYCFKCKKDHFFLQWAFIAELQ